MIAITLPVKAFTLTSYSVPFVANTSTDQSGGLSFFSSTISSTLPPPTAFKRNLLSLGLADVFLRLCLCAFAALGDVQDRAIARVHKHFVLKSGLGDGDIPDLVALPLVTLSLHYRTTTDSLESSLLRLLFADVPLPAPPRVG